jgi:predicted DNA-binding transcriptional regulator YafY
MRADRLVATLLLLQARGRVTAAEVAAELEVSLATARRDLEALSAAGVPVYPQPGRGGGWSLLGGARTDLSGLTAPESQALLALLGPSAGAVPEVRSALRKLVRALPETFRADAEAAARAVVVDAAGWGEQAEERPPLVAVLQDAVVRRRRIRFTYTSRSRGAAPGERVVDPWGLVAKDEAWYLVGGTEAGQRTFRVDRMDGVVVTDEVAERPAGFALDDAWQQVVEEVEQRRSVVEATVLVPERLVSVLRGQFGRHCEVLEVLDDGRAAVRVAAHLARSIAEHLAGLGAAAEVVEPDSVRAELACLGAELVARYGPARSAAAAGPEGSRR